MVKLNYNREIFSIINNLKKDKIEVIYKENQIIKGDFYTEDKSLLASFTAFIIRCYFHEKNNIPMPNVPKKISKFINVSNDIFYQENILTWLSTRQEYINYKKMRERLESEKERRKERIREKSLKKKPRL